MNPEETQTSDPALDQAIVTLMKDLPKPVQEFLLSEERGQVARDLSARYSLHADQAGAFEEAYLHMLLGIASPEAFAASLRKAGLAQEVIYGLAADVNSRVFMRLRDQERQQSAAPVPVPAPSSKPAPLPMPSLDYQPAGVPTLPGSPVLAPMPFPNAPVPAAPMLATLEPTPQQPYPVQPPHVVHAMPSTAQPGWHPAAAVHIFVPTQGPHLQPAPAQAVAAAFVPVPAAEVPAFAPPAPAGFVNPLADAYASQPATEKPITKDYVADPYREPTQ
jgi:hypothetical protein